MPELRAQRTLVKSPPELWAQVSDPVSLARHLGEFGEIRITRVVPEQTVAWEGERASGTVELTSSGWGTKVTLIAQLTDAAEPASQPEPAADAAPAAETRPADPFELINSLAREPLPRPAERLAGDEAEHDQEAAAETALDALSTHVEEAPVEPSVLVDAQHEHADAPAGEHLEEPHEAAEVTVGQEHGHEHDAWFAQSPDPAAAGDPSAWAAPAAAAATPDTQPGFFARLFGRRRRATAQATPLPVAAQAIDPEDVVASAPVPEQAAPIEAEAVAPEHEIVPTEAAETAPAESEVSPTSEAPEATSSEHEAAPPGAADAEPTEHEDAATEVAHAEPAEHDVALTDAEVEAVADPTDTEPASDEQPPEPAGDPVAVLDHARAEAVLTAVLDDLGAARHRPFSPRSG